MKYIHASNSYSVIQYRAEVSTGYVSVRTYHMAGDSLDEMPPECRVHITRAKLRHQVTL